MSTSVQNEIEQKNAYVTPVEISSNPISLSPTSSKRVRETLHGKSDKKSKKSKLRTTNSTFVPKYDDMIGLVNLEKKDEKPILCIYIATTDYNLKQSHVIIDSTGEK